MSSEFLSDTKKRMNGAIESISSNYSGVRAGRASTNLLDKIVVEVYGAPMPLTQVGTVSVSDSTMLSVQVWDKGNVDSVIKAISNSNLGVNPTNDGTLVRIPLPKLSEERRVELCKICSEYAENGKIAIRNIRRDIIDSLKKGQKAGDLSEDELHGNMEDVQKETDFFVKKIEDLLKAKKEEIMTV